MSKLRGSKDAHVDDAIDAYDVQQRAIEQAAEAATCRRKLPHFLRAARAYGRLLGNVGDRAVYDVMYEEADDGRMTHEHAHEDYFWDCIRD